MRPAFALPAVLLGIAFAAGCAALDDKGSAEPKAPREYRTGSNIPVKDPTPAATEADRESAAEQVRALQRTLVTGKPAGAGG